MLRSFQKLRRVDPGFDSSSALTFRVGLPNKQYPMRRAVVAVHQAISIGSRQSPASRQCRHRPASSLAEPASATDVIPERNVEDGRPRPFFWWRGVSGGYIETAGIRVLRGRTIERGDVERAEPVVVVNRALADVAVSRIEDPIGQRVKASIPPNSRFGTPAWLTVVGVVANTVTNALAETAPAGQLYMPMSIAGGPDIPARRWSVRTSAS